MRGSRRGRAARAGSSVWQQSLSVWRRAGLEWQRPAGWEPADADLQRTEPIPVVAAIPVPADAGPAGPPPGVAAAPGTQPAGTEPDSPASGAGDGQQPADGGRPAGNGQGPADSKPQAGNGQGPVHGERQAGRAKQEHPRRVRLHPRRGGRTVLVGAAICVALLAVAVGGIVITWPLNIGRHHGPSGLVMAYPSARPADAQFAGPGAPPAPAVLPSLTAVAAAGHTVVAVGSQATLPFARPLIVMSSDGGRRWHRTVLRTPGGGDTAGTVPLMVAGGNGRWLALGQDAAWTSPDGRSWQLGPGIAPLADGDRVLALAQTGGGFAAVGENVRPQGPGVVRTPVLWISVNGLTWQRLGADQLGLPAGKGRVVALRWVAARGSVLMIAGQVTRTVVKHHGKRKANVLTQSAGVWRSTDNGAHWTSADPPVSNGATTQLAGLAVTGSGIVAIRPGHGTGGTANAVAYVWGRGPVWHFAADLTASGGAGLNVTSVAGSDQGAVVAGSAGRNQVALVSRRGWSWRQTADLGRSSATRLTGVTAGPGRKVVAAGAGRPGPFLLLVGGHRSPVGQSALAGAAAYGLGVNGLGAGPGGQVAVGHANGEPAIWLRPANGQWARMAVEAPPSWYGTGPGLTTVVHGGEGWLAVGGEGSQAGSVVPVGAAGTLDSATALAGQQPILLTSPDGTTWRPAAGAASLAVPGVTLTGATAGPSGYVVAGIRDDHGRPAAALWWSADLTSWAPQGSWVGTGPAGAASALLAVASGQGGFAAVGAAGAHPAVWLSHDGQSWRLRPLAVPAGASSAVLQRVAIQGRRIAALGVEARPAGPVPFAAVSVNGGSTWREIALPVPARPAGVTALASVGGGFLAAGTLGAGGGQDVIVWWSADGLTWKAVRPAGKWLSVAGAQQITGLSVSGTTLTGVGYAATGTGQHPILWQARTR
ncbi:MAG TPA: hypothetical protein VEC76_02240 [Streptosporangiaceae bacterium]|nr:hypothetical protein [Streptosporangiaceae bacterium]